ncbi:hypothetical protein [Flindersiella endophytica]
MTGAQAWLDYYYAVASYGHHTQGWDALGALHAAAGCGQCDAIPDGSRLARPGEIRRSPIVGGPSPVLSDGGDSIEIVTAVELVLPDGRIQEQYIDRVTLAWDPAPRDGWQVTHLTFHRIE